MIKINVTQLIGNIGREIEMKYSKDGKAIAKFSLAVQDDYNREKTHWVDITCFGKIAELTNQYLGKGSKCAIVGKLNHETWEQEGQNRSKLAVIADRVEFLGGKSDDKPKRTSKSKPVESDDLDSDFPF